MVHNFEVLEGQDEWDDNLQGVDGLRSFSFRKFTSELLSDAAIIDAVGAIFCRVESMAERSVLDKIFKIACSIFGTVPFLFGVWISGWRFLIIKGS